MSILDAPARFRNLPDITVPTVDGQIMIYNETSGNMEPGVRNFSAGIVGFGHSFLRIGCAAQQLSINRLAGIVGNVPVKNNGVSGATLILGDQTSGKSNGGFSAVFQKWQKIPSTAIAQSYLTPQAGLPVILTGVNDAGHLIDLTTQQIADYRFIFNHTYRSILAYLSGALYLEAETSSPSTAIATTFAGSGTWSVTSTTRYNSGTGYRSNPTSGATISHAFSAGAERYVDMIFLGPSTVISTPSSPITFTLDGSTVHPVGFPSTFDTSTVMPYWGQSWYSLYPCVARFLIPSGSHTLVATAGSGGMTLDSIVYEADSSPPILCCNIARTPSTNALTGTTLTGQQANDYLNAEIDAVVSEFDNPVIQIVDIDTALNFGDVLYWNSVDLTHPNDTGNRVMAEAMYGVLAALPMDIHNITALPGPREVAVVESVCAVAITNISLSGSTAVDGYTPQMNDRMLVTGQTNTINNGVWVVNTGGVWTRPLDFASGMDVQGKAVYVRGGSVYAGTHWVLPSTSSIYVDVTAQTTWQRGGYTIGSGLTVASSTNTLKADGPTLNGYGLASARPAAASTNTGFLYYATDTSTLSRSNGTTWDTLLGTLATKSTVASSDITDGTIVNGDINASAGITYGKLALTDSVVNADIAAAAAIAYSKLTLTGSILAADIVASAGIPYSKLTLTGAVLNADLAGSIAYSKLSLTGAILNADLAGSIALSKLATDPLARANHTGTQTMSTISDAGSLATLSAVASAQITDGTIVAGDINASAAIALSQLATQAAATVVGVPVGGGTVVPTALTAAQVRTLTGIGIVDSLDNTTTPSTVVNTSVATTFMTVSMPAVVAGDRFHLVAAGDLLQNSGGSATYIWQALFGATSIATSAAATQTNQAARGAWDMDIYITCPATARQVVSGRFSTIATGAGNGFGAATTLFFNGKNMTVDLSAATSLIWKVTMSVAHASTDWRTYGYTLDRMR